MSQASALQDLLYFYIIGALLYAHLSFSFSPSVSCSDDGVSVHARTALVKHITCYDGSCYNFAVTRIWSQSTKCGAATLQGSSKR